MKKIILSVLAAVVIFLIVFWLFVTLSSKNEQVDSSPTGDAIDLTTDFSSEIIYEEKESLDPELQNKVETVVQSGTQITEDFYRISSYPKTDSLATEVDYSIDYSKQSNSFTIALYKYPLLETRTRASQDFLEMLQITQEVACQMNVKVTVSSSVNVRLAGENLRLSFCEDRVDLTDAVDDRVSNEE